MTQRRAKIEGKALQAGEMSYLLAFAGLDWPIIRWVFGYTLNHNAQGMARRAAQWGGLPWIDGHPPTQSQRGLLLGHTRKRGDGRGVTHGRTLAQVADGLVEMGIIGIIADGNRTKGARAYLLRAMGCGWRAVADITKVARTNTVIAAARKFGARTPSLPQTAPVMVDAIVNRGQRVYEYAESNPEATWVQVAESFSMSETGARNAADSWVQDFNGTNPDAQLEWPLRMTRDDPGRTAYHRYIDLGTWQSVADDMGYATPSSARDVAWAFYERSKDEEDLTWLPGSEA